MFYFAYGSNMNLADLERWSLRKDYAPVKPKSWTVARLPASRLAFNYYSRVSRKGGVLNIMDSPGNVVCGVLFDLDDGDFEKIEEKEGSDYKQINAKVLVGEKSFEVITFKVKEECVGEFYPPTDEYLNVVIEGAKNFGLSKDCIDNIKKAARKS